jgi:hypothetical protein
MNPYVRRKPWLIPIFIVGFITLASFAVMLLWNNIVPQILPSVRPLEYWQATGLLILCRILFGGFHKGGHHHRHGGPWNAESGGPGMEQQDRGPWNGGPPWGRNWRNMTEEDKVKFREEWRKRRFGGWCAPGEESAPPAAPAPTE